MISNKELNYRILHLIELYNIDIKFIFISLNMKNLPILYVSF
jgi:hypothetical protein